MAHRIVVVGVSGNGKTTLSRRLAAQLGVPYVELDALNRAPALAREVERWLRCQAPD